MEHQRKQISCNDGYLLGVPRMAPMMRTRLRGSGLSVRSESWIWFGAVRPWASPTQAQLAGSTAGPADRKSNPALEGSLHRKVQAGKQSAGWKAVQAEKSMLESPGWKVQAGKSRLESSRSADGPILSVLCIR
ncbi:hypothetical protein L2E82_37548 [Cichorium intybus]|uniref:Uncharacterized protein n=1 Tax=Cichorium intybus TaxID=13427 RepID=A0ACB9AEK3_CICIN|nr:hypothetical protein L2E82_37548 [Cichorium intybus]